VSDVADLYKALGVAPDADAAAIKKAFRDLAKKHHPDTHPGDKASEERFKEISQAYEILSDPEKRRRYDAMRQSPFAGSAGRGPGPGAWGPEAGGGFDGGSVEDLFEMFFGAGGSPFGGGGFRQRRAPAKGADLESEVDVAFEDAALGRPVTVHLEGQVQPLRLNLPPGAESGLRLRLAGQGAGNGRGGPRGDLYLTLRVRPSQQYRREGLDVVGKLKVNLAQALLGASVEVQTLHGARRLKLQAGLPPGTRLRLAGQGIETDAGKGDHYVEVDVELPKELDAAESAAVEAMAKRRGWEL
jgi:DnaJ-class molecular chaperone